MNIAFWILVIIAVLAVWGIATASLFSARVGKTVYSSSNSSFPYPMTELLDYVWLLEENNRGLKTDVVYLQIGNRIVGMIERINNADKQQREG